MSRWRRCAWFPATLLTPDEGHTSGSRSIDEGGTALRYACAEARDLLCTNDTGWNKVAPLTQESDAKLQAALRKDYCAGLVKHWGAEEKQAVAKLYGLLRQTGGPALTGQAGTLPGNIFWPYTLGR